MYSLWEQIFGLNSQVPKDKQFSLQSVRLMSKYFRVHLTAHWFTTYARQKS